MFITRMRRGAALASAVVLGLVIVVGSAAPAASAATTVCNPVSRKYEVREAGAGIGLIHVKTNVCTAPGRPTTSTGSITWQPNPLGSAAGWRFQSLGTSRVASGSTGGSWTSKGVFTLCVPTQVSPLCSYGEAFKVSYAGYAKSFRGPQVSPRFSCTNTYCRKAMTFVYKGWG
jgi:hypothetical protein